MSIQFYRVDGYGVVESNRFVLAVSFFIGREHFSDRVFFEMEKLGYNDNYNVVCVSFFLSLSLSQ